jgi:hypothetical protein
MGWVINGVIVVLVFCFRRDAPVLAAWLAFCGFLVLAVNVFTLIIR